jgi:hypothetical protein
MSLHIGLGVARDLTHEPHAQVIWPAATRFWISAVELTVISAS